MCTANSAPAQSAAQTTQQTATTKFYQNPTFWKKTGTSLAISSGILGAGSALADARAQKATYDAQAYALENNAQLSAQQAQRQVAYDLQQSAHEVTQLRRAGRQTFAKQLTAAVGSGMDLSSTSLQQAVLDSHRAEQEDIDLIKRNASTRAYQTTLQAELNEIAAQGQAQQNRIAGRYAKKAGRINAFSSLLSSAGMVAGMWSK